MKHCLGLFFAFLLDFYQRTSSVELNMRVSGKGGEISSPNYPSKYPLNLTCIWTVSVEENERVSIKFIDFQLEQAKRCIYDYVQMREDDTKPWEIYPKHCGRNAPDDLETKGAKAQIRFYSDSYNIVDKGFKLQWEAKSVESNTKIVPCPTQSTRVEVITVCQTAAPSQGNCNCPGSAGTGNSVDGSGNNGKDCTGQMGCQPHAIKRTEEKTDKVVVAAFSTLLALFILVCAVLIIMLWRRTRELEYLRTPPKSPDFQWIPGHRFSTQNIEQHQNRAQDGSLMRQITNASKVCDNQDCTLCSLNRHLNRYTNSSLDASQKEIMPNGREPYSNPFPRLLSVTESRQSIHSDANSIPESETSDIYISSCLQTPADTFEREPNFGIYPAKCAV